MKPNRQRIEALEREIGISGPAPKAVAELAGYVVLMDHKNREASERVRVSFTVGSPRPVAGELKLDIKINGGAITLAPTRFGSVRAVAVFDDGGTMPACNPDRSHAIGPGDTFTVEPF